MYSKSTSKKVYKKQIFILAGKRPYDVTGTIRLDTHGTVGIQFLEKINYLLKK